LLACFCCDFWLCSCCCSLMVVAPTNLVALNLGQSCKKIWRILTLFPHYLHTIACYHYAYCMAPPSLCDQRIRIISLPPSLSSTLKNDILTFSCKAQEDPNCTHIIACLLALLAYQEGKDIVVFRFIIEYSSLRDFGLTPR
jgi:hypothetical protein